MCDSWRVEDLKKICERGADIDAYIAQEVKGHTVKWNNAGRPMTQTVDSFFKKILEKFWGKISYEDLRQIKNIY